MLKTNILLYSAGLGYINRGLETFTQELYQTLRQHEDVNLTLFQGQGEVLNGARAVWLPKRNAKFYEAPLLNHFKSQSYKIENIIFSLPIILHCYSQPGTIIHFSETIPANILYHLRKRWGGSFKLLFSNGGPTSPEHYRRYDYVQVLTPAQKQEALEAGFPEKRLFFIPYGLNCQLFSKQLTPQEVIAKRKQWNLPVDRSIILSVGAVNSSHKRMDWLIKEFSSLAPEKFYLWIIGQPEKETQKVKDLAKFLLKPDSYRFDVISYAQMPDVYAIADYFVLCSLGEGFGRVYIEAMAAGLPVIAHRNMNTEWILGLDNLGLLDMTKSNNLKELINYLENHVTQKNAQSKSNKSAIFARFDWQSLQTQYINMYRKITGA